MVLTALLILGITVLVFIHELGHYLAARSTGMRVEKFSVGFPPRFIQPFTWFMNGKHVSTKIETFIKTGEAVKSRRGLSFSAAERELYRSLFVQKEE